MKKKHIQQVELPDTQPYDRCWPCNGMHRWNNKVMGAFGPSKREMQMTFEAKRKEIKKLRKQKKQLKLALRVDNNEAKENYPY